MAHYLYFTFKNDEPIKGYVGMTKYPISTGYKGSGGYILKALKKYGSNNFTRIDLGEYEDKVECHYWEGFYIRYYKTLVSQGGYNISPKGGLGTPGCVIHTDEAKRKIGLASRNRIVSEETRRKHSLSHTTKGQHLSNEHKRKLSIATKGRKLSDETKRKISERMKGNTIWLGRHHKEDTKQRISISEIKTKKKK